MLSHCCEILFRIINPHVLSDFICIIFFEFSKRIKVFKYVRCFPFIAFHFLKNLFMLFIYLWLCWVFVAAHGLSLVAASGGYSVAVHRLLIAVAFLLRITGSRRVGFSSCGMQTQQLWRTGLVAPQHVGSFWTRA